MISRFHISTTRPSQSLERLERSVRRTSSVTMPTASSSIAAGSTKAAQLRLARGRPETHKAAMASNLKEFAPEGIEGELRRLHYDTANATFAPSMAALMKLVPISQITYGTDYPYFGFGQVADLQKLGLSAGDLDAIGHENATRLIPRLK